MKVKMSVLILIFMLIFIQVSYADLGIVSVKDFGAKGDGLTNDIDAFNTSIHQGSVIYIPAGVYLIKDRIVLANISNKKIVFDPNSKIICDFNGLGYNADAIHIIGNSHDLIIENANIENATAFGIQILGEGYINKPYNITVKNLRTKNCTWGGLFINSSHDIEVDKVFNDGGFRAIGTKAPINEPNVCYNVKISKVTSINTTQFCVQTYYGNNILIEGCMLDASCTTSQDRSCITVDRSKNTKVVNNFVKNSPANNIFVTGVEGVIVVGNTSIGGQYGIQICFNFEHGEDASINESKNVIVTNNTVFDYTTCGVILNGAKKTTIATNAFKTISDVANDIYIMGFQRADGINQVTEEIIVTGNSSEKKCTIANRGYINGGITFLGNTFPEIIGVDTNKDICINNGQSINLGRKQVENFGLLKRSGLSDDTWLMEFRPTNETVNHGMVIKYVYGECYLSDPVTNTDRFVFGIGSNGSGGDIKVLTPGRGILIKTPDGTKTYRISVDNSGIITSTPVN